MNDFDQMAQSQSTPAAAPAASAVAPATSNTGNDFEQMAQQAVASTPTTTTGTGLSPAEMGTLAANIAASATPAGANPLTAGVAKGTMETLHTLGAAAGKVIPNSWRDALGLPSSFKQPDYLTSTNGAETAGKVAENIAEFAMGDEALKGLQITERLGIAQKMASMAKSSPYIAKILEHGLNAVRQGAVTVPQQMLHGATPTEALKTGAEATVLGAGTGAVLEGASAGGRALANTETGQAVRNIAKQVVQGEKVAQPGAQSAVREGVQSSVETTNAAADRAAEPTRVHSPDIDPTVRDHARLNPFPGEDVRIKTFPGTPATETEAATNPTARITGPNGSSIELELDGKIARVKGIINSGKPGDGQRLYDNAIAWAKDSGYDTFEGDTVQTEAAKTAWGRVAERHNARMAEEAPHTPSIDLRGSRPAPEVAASDVTPVKTVKLPEATEPLTENSKTTIVDDHLDALEQQKSSAYKRMDDTAGFDVKALKDKLKTDKYNLKQLGSSDPDKTGRLVEAINDSTDRIAEANEKMRSAGIDPDYADALNKRWEAGQDYKASLLKRTNPDGSMNVKGLWDDAKKMRNDPEYGDRLEQWFGSKDAADAYVKALEKAHAEGLQAMKRQAFARQILWRVAGTTAAGAVGLGLYDATH